jgi:hypothetical protein
MIKVDIKKIKRDKYLGRMKYCATLEVHETTARL